MKMLANRYERERDIAQRTTTIPGAERLRAEMKDVMEQLVRVAREAAYYMGLYHQAVPLEQRRGVVYSEKHFMEQINTLLRRGNIPIPMDTLWAGVRMTPGASSSGTGSEGMPLIGHPILPPPPGRPE